MKRLTFVMGLFGMGMTGFANEGNFLEQLLGVTVNEQGISFQVASNGCTTKTDFSFQVEEILEPLSPMLPAMEHHYYIAVARGTQDACEAFVPYGTVVFMSFEELGISFGKFHVKNPIGGDKLQMTR